jgi:hypothetical protein
VRVLSRRPRRERFQGLARVSRSPSRGGRRTPVAAASAAGRVRALALPGARPAGTIRARPGVLSAPGRLNAIQR